MAQNVQICNEDSFANKLQQWELTSKQTKLAHRKLLPMFFVWYTEDITVRNYTYIFYELILFLRTIVSRKAKIRKKARQASHSFRKSLQFIWNNIEALFCL